MGAGVGLTFNNYIKVLSTKKSTVLNKWKLPISYCYVCYEDKDTVELA